MARLNAAAITPAPGYEPFTLQPLIGHLLQTRRCIPGSIFLVEGIDVMPVAAASPDEDDSHAIRLVLGDGELCVQALLHPDMFHLVEQRDVFVGCCVRVGDFMLRLEEPDGGGVFGEGGEEEEEEEDEDGAEDEEERRERREEDAKTMAYLIVNELETCGWNETYMALWRNREKSNSLTDSTSAKGAAVVEEDRDQGAAPGEAATTTPKASKPQSSNVVRFADRPDSPSVSTPTKTPSRTPTKTQGKVQEKGKAKVSFQLPGFDNDNDNDDNDDDEDDEDDEDLEEAFEAFETRTFPLRSAITGARNRTAAAAAASTKPMTPTSDAREMAAAGDINTDKSQQQQQQQQPIALPRDWHNQQVPLKLTTLRLIPHLPYAQNWSCNVLAIIASLSPVESSHLPPGKQRTARIADPSTAKQVHLTVFLDPDGFTPKVGSAVLLVGVKNHRFDGGSLKKYASDGKKDAGEKRWWFEDPWELEWLDVAGIKEWWKGMEEYYRQTGPARSEGLEQA
ncbi:hypothetical protein TGAM01_v208134 [Trichoderma gamsii]|uniref:Uncharacterized protein n=1 Tax=Trichoderma gamsii TaxID=398673 RepID=A0A2P4ZF24_9HYPO|nr:hypothetical protein TGAM01_v208134 [Trichoderma gamsii]PON22879.1 hypothetical protein TGAM01_v208134 [Trichoderma gamsii]